MENNDLIYLNAFNLIPGIGRPRLREIRHRFSTFKKAWEKIGRGFSLDDKNANFLERAKETNLKIDPEKEWQKLEKEKIELIDLDDPRYPELLKETPDSPFCFYLKGKLPANSYAIAIVGTRRSSAYGKQAAEFFSGSLARLGITVVSGLALGIDSEAHKSAIAAGGKTIAVLGTGLDNLSIYPPQNRALAKQIIETGGALVSEYPLDAKPESYHFPERNRIISGLSLGVLVIEAPEKSGALITANLALEQNREVFAVPGSIFSKTSLGPNELIKKGAKLVTGVNDILEELNIKLDIINPEITALNLPLNEQKILKLVEEEPQNLDKIIQESKMHPSEVMSAVTMLEIKGLIKNLGGNNYVKKGL
ncbi:MAG: DNA-processing protein DprA [bacterium]|nr:DNA-processing protein DprA [bacterium]